METFIPRKACPIASPPEAVAEVSMMCMRHQASPRQGLGKRFGAAFLAGKRRL